MDRKPLTQSWQPIEKEDDAASFAPEVKTSADKESVVSFEKEVVPSAEKERANDDGKEVAPDRCPEVVEEESFPEPIDDEGSKEVVSRDLSRAVYEKGPPMPIQRATRTRLMTCLAVAMTALVIALAIGLGVGLGVTSHQLSPTASPSISISLYGASPISSPTGLAPPTGTFALALGEPTETKAAYLVHQGQQAAWNCSLAPDHQLNIAVESVNGSESSLEARIFHPPDETFPEVYYGAQAPKMNTTAATLLPVIDNSKPGYGPAFYFQQVYDKIVMLPEDTLSTRSKRSLDSRQVKVKRRLATSGEKPWFCIFNGTLLEGFIYMEKPSHSTSIPTSEPATSTITSRPFSNDPTSAASTTPSTSNAVITTSTAPSRNLSAFPFKIKLEERRTPNPPTQPYCQQYQILDDGSANWLADEDGNPVRIKLEESASAGDCFCQWMSA